ncbi:MAG: aminotransferase class I/II-fold pyridoxal phosphate-dependent enzyme [Paludibacteraceae bacterium]|nr:aminotransferase class I/II-fold pyridoxal phosphate-dependent enzyme [Paludibacteraceae bacterium]
MSDDLNLTVDQQFLRQYYSRYGGFWRFPNMLDYCYLVNPCFKDCGIIREMQEFFPTLVTEYPSGMVVNSSLAGECWGVKPEYIIPGNGAAELIKVLMESTEGKVGVIRPTFEEYPNRLSEEQLVPFVSEKTDFRYDEDDLIEFFSCHPIDTLLLINPDNPSGNFIDKKGLLKLIAWTKKRKIKLVLDESFVDFSVGYTENSCVENILLEENPHMMVVKSISKSYGVPGLRLGILCSGDKALLAAMKKRVSIWNINSFAEFFMQIFPKYRMEYKEACDTFIRIRDKFQQELEKIPYIHVMPSQANYFFLEVFPPYEVEELCAILLKDYNILVSACLAKKGIEPNRFMRIAVRDEKDNNRFIQVLKDLTK